MISFRLACRCAKESSTKGHSHFGLQYYGECWSDPQAADKFDRYGESEDCMGFGFKQCDDEESSECVGGADKNYVYRVVEEGKFYLNIYLYLRFFSVWNFTGVVMKFKDTAAAYKGDHF